MTVTISDRARSIQALMEERSQLQEQATWCNEHMAKLIAEFHKMTKETSTLQLDILEKMAAIDKAVEDFMKM